MIAGELREGLSEGVLMWFPRLSAILLVTAAALATPVMAVGAPIYAVTMGQLCCPARADEVIRIDSVTGVVTSVGSLSTPMYPLGLAFRGRDLYVADQVQQVLRRIDPETAANLGEVALALPNGYFAAEGDLAFRRDGIGFYSDLDGLTGFDVRTGATQFIGATVDIMDGLAFNQTGVLYGYGQNTASLYTIDMRSGLATLVGPTGLGISQTTTAGLAFSAGGTLYFNNGIRLFTLDPDSGTATLVRDTFPHGAGVSGLAFPVPEPGAVLLLLAASLVWQRGRRRSTCGHSVVRCPPHS